MLSSPPQNAHAGPPASPPKSTTNATTMRSFIIPPDSDLWTRRLDRKSLHENPRFRKRGFSCRLFLSSLRVHRSESGGIMKLRIVVALVVLLGGLAGGPAWAFWGGEDSIDDPIHAH